MKYIKYFYVIIALLVILIVGELIYFFSTDIYPQITQKNNTTVSGQNGGQTSITQSNTPYNFNDYEKGNYFTYTNDQDIQKLYISLKINGSLKKENGMYVLPVSLLGKNVNLILGYPERKILFHDNSKEKNLILNATLLKDAINNSEFNTASFIRISLPLSEYANKTVLLNDKRCDETCRNSLLLIEGQISANQGFLELVRNKNKFSNSKDITDIGPILDLILLNKNE